MLSKWNSDYITPSVGLPVTTLKVGQPLKVSKKNRYRYLHSMYLPPWSSSSVNIALVHQEQKKTTPNVRDLSVSVNFNVGPPFRVSKWNIEYIRVKLFWEPLFCLFQNYIDIIDIIGLRAV